MLIYLQAGWTPENTASYSGPTPEVVAGMAENVRAKLGSTYCICESGTAGPGASGEGRNRQPYVSFHAPLSLRFLLFCFVLDSAVLEKCR